MTIVGQGINFPSPASIRLPRALNVAAIANCNASGPPKYVCKEEPRRSGDLSTRSAGTHRGNCARVYPSHPHTPADEHYRAELESEGPVIERQRRRGKDGRLVLLLKFRTVHIAQNGHFNGVRGGTTRVGEVLQYTRADELPKLFNVIRGETTLAHLMELD